SRTENANGRMIPRPVLFLPKRKQKLPIILRSSVTLSVPLPPKPLSMLPPPSAPPVSSSEHRHATPSSTFFAGTSSAKSLTCSPKKSICSYTRKSGSAPVSRVGDDALWRRRGVAALLIQRIMHWSREQRLDRLVLHASDEG